MPIEISFEVAEEILRGLEEGIENLKALVDCHMDRHTGRPMEGQGNVVRQTEARIKRLRVVRRKLSYDLVQERARRDGRCRVGDHDWVQKGGRACPKELSVNCSQPAFRCSRCGSWDYGEEGGPGWKYCQDDCEREGDEKPE